MRVDIENKDTVFLPGSELRVIYFFLFIFSIFSLLSIVTIFYRKKMYHIFYISIKYGFKSKEAENC